MAGASALGQTSDPTVLIPGDVSRLYLAADELRAYGDQMDLAGRGLRRIDTEAGWSGQAGDAFRTVYQGQPSKWLIGSDAFHEAADTLRTFAGTLTWAQGQAAEAIGIWNQGPASHLAAVQALADACRQLDEAGNVAAAKVTAARNLAPPPPAAPSLWNQFTSDVGGFFGNVGNGLASFGNAAVHDTGALAQTAGGLLLTGVSGLGDGVGGVLDATGIGLPAGLPLNAVSTAGLITGAGLAGEGVRALVNGAAGPDHVQIWEARAKPSSSGDGRNLGDASKAASKLGRSRKDVLDAIHDVKYDNAWRGNGRNTNPDVLVDLNTGEAYPKLPNGQPADDPIGNIFEYLPPTD
jgi:hypothetical protein